jgi:CheY-like chemotaxis protein
MSVLILVVDDEPDVADLFRQQFRRDLRNGTFVLSFACCAEEALATLRDPGDDRLILVLSDINMPGMSGMDLLPKVRAAYPDVPVIMITAYGDAETRREAEARGAECLLTKPIDFTLLRPEIERRLSG